MTAVPAPLPGRDVPAGPAPMVPSAAGMSAALTAISASGAAQFAAGPTVGVADLVDALAELVPARLTVHQRESLETSIVAAIDSRILALRVRCPAAPPGCRTARPTGSADTGPKTGVDASTGPSRFRKEFVE